MHKSISKLKVLFTFFYFFLMTNAFAEDNNKITLYGGNEYLYYYELLANDDGSFDHNNEVRGNIPGGGITFSKLFFDKLNFVFDASRFTGSPESSNDQGHFFIPQSVTDINARLEYNIPIQKIAIIPFGQLGYRYWHRSVEGVTVSEYSEYYYTNYYALGLKLGINVTQKLNVAPFYGIGSTFTPRMRSTAVILSDSGGSIFVPPGGNHLGKEVYKMFGLDINYQINNHLQFYLGYLQNNFGFGTGFNDVTVEPSSKTLQRVYKAGLTYSF